MCKKSVPSCLGSKLKMAGGAGLIRYLEKQKKMVMVMLNLQKSPYAYTAYTQAQSFTLYKNPLLHGK